MQLVEKLLRLPWRYCKRTQNAHLLSCKLRFFALLRLALATLATFFNKLLGHTGLVWWAAWNVDESHILTASDDGTARVWDAETGEQILILSGHTDGVRQAMWNTDESRILTAGEDGTVRQWYTQMDDLLTVACQQTPRNLTREEWQRYFPDETYRPTCPNLPIPTE